MIIRAVLPDDAPAVVALLAELGHPIGADVVPARLNAVLADGGAAFLAMDDEAGALGFFSVTKHAVLHAAGPVGLITALVVAERARGRGVGRLMVDSARAWAREAGCVRLLVTSAEHRAAAHAFYPACGMPYTGRRFATDIAR